MELILRTIMLMKVRTLARQMDYYVSSDLDTLITEALFPTTTLRSLVVIIPPEETCTTILTA